MKKEKFIYSRGLMVLSLLSFHEQIPEWVMSAVIVASAVSMVTFSYLVVGTGTVSSGGTLVCLSLAIKNYASLVVY